MQSIKILRLHLTLFFLILITITGCAQDRLVVYTDYLSRENLASYHVGTPDPCLNCPNVGQRLIIQWRLPIDYMCFDDLHLLLKVRFKNHEQIEQTIPIRRCTGTYVYSLLNDEYFEKNGIQTYLVQIIGDDMVFDEWRQQLWVEMIQADNSCK